MSANINQNLFDFIRQHKDEDPNSLRLRYHKTDADSWIHLAINHIEALKKSGRKFGDLQPELMATPLSVEQASSAVIAKLHGKIAKAITTNVTSFLDMTCGLGIDFRAISEGLGNNCRSTAVELNPDLAYAANYNFRNINHIRIIEENSIHFLENSTEHFDLIFIDPARRDSAGGRLYNIRDCQPDVISLIPIFREKASHVMVKLSPMLDVSRTLADLPCSTLHVIDDGKECREILAVMDFSEKGLSGTDIDNVPVTIHSGEHTTPFTFCRNMERRATPKFLTGIPTANQWIFEPSPAAMKAAPFSLLCMKYDLYKLHQNTHIYVADTPTEGLPGKWYRINEVIPFSSSNIRHIAREKIKADVAVRNFPLKAEELSHRIGATPGGDMRIIGVTCNDNSRILIMLDKVAVSK
ncbi:MAG: hypothetical protein HDS68_04705 [Bacteroidales bacterium]|nr:hypothetical protein [Bacteroidales bacterium]